MPSRTYVSVSDRIQRAVRSVAGKLLLWTSLIVFAVFSVVPMLWLILAPSKTQTELIDLDPLAFGSFAGYVNSWNNLMVFQDGRIITWVFNSIWYTTIIVIIACGSALLAGYALAATRLPFRKPLLIVTLVAMIVPPVAFVLPLFVQISSLGLYNSPWAIILTGSFYPFGVFLAYIYFSTTIPHELYDAARIDGAGEWGTFFRIAMPLSTGLLGMLGFFAFTANWVNFFLPYVMVNTGELLTLPVGLGILFSSTPALNPGVGANSSPIRGPEIALAGLMVAIPILLVFLASARLIVRGVLSGSVKS
ncbi:MAG: carbohydrate ABC transporter permease [Aquiluna sp.]|nr:carbohydrate ABC transporter permease [Aquiluna sp.]